MIELNETRKKAEEWRDYAMDGQNVAPGIALRLLISPLLALLDLVGAKDGRWLTLHEAKEQSGRGKNYFEKPLRSLEDRSRLQAWQAEGLAELARTGEEGAIWLISPLKVQEAARDRDGEMHEEGPAPGGLDRDALINEFLG
jgi:hypothetical protein